MPIGGPVLEPIDMLAVETIRGVNGKGKVTAEIRHFVSSAKVAPEA
ncbi:MAG: hypothetical protein K0R41_4433, partial [Geminicoccaceae bacterium]|nr:hypothetical protein [Geminicoccaceae bacterium]MDF2782374.1 hypothetical protein [Geminicoccaceae bacterium]